MAKKSKKSTGNRSGASGFGRGLQRLGRFVLSFALWFVGLSLGWVLLLKFVPPPGTWLMVGQWFALEGESPRWDYRFRKGEALGSNLGLAVIAAEDQRFGQHHGFDLEAIEKAMEHNEKGGKVRGASTISQQTAKNVFLWPARSWVRKGLEVWFTLLIELVWGKERILEVYQNIAEFGPGIYGAEAAAQQFFGKSAQKLSRSEAALLAAVLPSPRRYSAARPSAYVQRRQRWILRQMNNLHSVEAVLHPEPEPKPAKSAKKRTSKKD